MHPPGSANADTVNPFEKRYNLQLTMPSLPAPIYGGYVQEATPVQMVNSATVKKLYGSTWLTDMASPGLDTSYPYMHPTLVTAYAEDSPRVPLQTCDGVQVNHSFSMYFLFRATRGDTDWVPLRKVDWKWIASATKMGGTWGTPTSTSPTASGPNKPVDTDTTIHPKWTKYITWP